MTEELIATHDEGAGQVVLSGLPTGPAGGAAIAPVNGIDLLFDRSDGHLVEVVLDDRPLEREGADLLVRLFGHEAEDLRSLVSPTYRQRILEKLMLRPDAELSGSLSRLARLYAVRTTSPVPATSPLWAAEAAQLAMRAGLDGRAREEARRAAPALAALRLPHEIDELRLVVADLAEEDEPEASAQLRSSVGWAIVAAAEQFLAEQEPVVLAVLGEGLGDDKSAPDLQRSLDPDLVPEGIFLPGLSPLEDVHVSTADGDEHLVVEVSLRPGAGDRLGGIWARLVDPALRSVLAKAPFEPVAAPRGRPVARAVLLSPLGPDEFADAWLEIVDDEHRPVRGTTLRQMRRALRWADAALRAEQRPRGLGRWDWDQLAATAWEHCRYDWELMGDADRAYVAARRLATLDEHARMPEPASSWAQQLADRPQGDRAPFLAEDLTGVIVPGRQ